MTKIYKKSLNPYKSFIYAAIKYKKVLKFCCTVIYSFIIHLKFSYASDVCSLIRKFVQMKYR